MDFLAKALRSKTYWGIGIIVLAQIAAQLGVGVPVDVTDAAAAGMTQDTLDGITRVFTGIGSLLALYGRAVAKAPLI